MPIKWLSFCSLMLLAHFGYAQEHRISLELSDVPLHQVMDSIESRLDLAFSFSSRKVDVDQKVSIHVSNESLSEVFLLLSSQTNYSFSLIEQQIIIKKKAKASVKQSLTIKKQSFTISGFVSDSLNGESLVGTTVLIKELGQGTITNLYGFYSMTVAPGDYTVEYSFIGYKKEIKVIKLRSNVSYNIEFTTNSEVLPEVIVKGSKPREIEEIQTSKSYVSPKEIIQMPSLMGELDVIKSLSTIPGVKMYADGSTFFSVRGGAKDQNLILLDEAPIYNPSHLLGLFSSIIPEAINDMTLYKGDFPASYGGRLSSLVNIKTNEGNLKNLSVWGSLGLISTKIGVEAPFVKDKSSFFIAVRRSHLRWYFEQLNSEVDKLHFYDITGKANFKINARNKLFFSFYTGEDIFENNNSGISWGNNTGTIRWNHLFNDKLFSNTTFYASGYDYLLHTNVANNDHWTSHIDNANLKSDFSWFVTPTNMVSFGFSVGAYQFDPGNYTSGDGVNPIPVSKKNTAETVLYAGNEIKFNDHWGIRYGLRFTRWSNVGEGFEFEYNDQGLPIQRFDYEKGERYNSYHSLEPRLNISYFIHPTLSLKASYNRMAQNLHLISNSISPFTTLDVWLPSSLNIKPQTGDIFTLGVSKVWNSGINVEVEGYRKYMQNQIDYREHARMLLNPFYEGQLLFGKANAWGVETSLKKTQGRIRGSMGYTYSRVTHQFDDINNGQPYPGFFDRPHEINIVTSYDISLRIQLGINWIYYTGAPFSSPTGFYYHDFQEIPIYSVKNNDRFPDYHRLDISANFQLNKEDKKFKHSIGVSIFNVYGNKNPVFMNFNKAVTANNEIKIPGNLFTAERISSQTYYYGFLPSLVYKFKFQ